ncbi:tyrosine-type recombinase/integrase [Erythrobacter dokdonensis]|uniref:Integrase family protein n=1 Tax=Erythrobacter dokdonensis DSW-74 TaxID=1300349 RepID=A0A1A7BK52_9SPHN|nr:integrase family protein [Erythrobacter dokdonensis]OBV11560.1 Integrase family protein [Erythrobacter dokdonensis DSW-74]
MARLTDEAVASAKPPKSGFAYLWDDTKEGLGGFGARINAKGGRSWVARYRVGGKQRIQTFAPVAGLSVTKARKKAGELIAAAMVGVDGVAEVRRLKAQAGALTIADLVAQWLDHQQGRLARSAIRSATYAAMQCSTSTLDAKVARLPAGELTRSAAADWKDKVAGKRGPRVADVAAAHLASAFDHALLRGKVDGANPFRGLPKAGETRPRERVLDDDELRAIWGAAKPETDYGSIIRLLILTGARRNEIAQMRSGEVAGRWFTLPAARSKNRRPHAIYLAPPALARVRQRLGRAVLFGEADNGFSGWSRSKQRLDDASATSDWTIHDLRRTVATRMHGIGIAPHIVEACLNHVSGARAGVAGIYNRHRYEAETREAWIKWAWHLRQIVRGA